MRDILDSRPGDKFWKKSDPRRCHYFEPLSSRPPLGSRGGGGGSGTVTGRTIYHGFAARLDEIRREKFPRFPFYGVILCTKEAAFDTKIQKHIVDKWEYLHRMTGEACLVFAVSDQPSRNVKARYTFDDAAIYDIANRLAVPATALPCVVLVQPPTGETIETLVVSFADHIPVTDDPSAAEITRVFRAMAAALQSCQHKNKRNRIDCVRKELNASLRPRRRGVTDALEVAGRSSENVNKTIVAAQAVGSALVLIASRLLGGP
jgi:hypothetical protein